MASFTKVTGCEPNETDAWLCAQIGHVSEAEQAFNKGLSVSQPEAPQVHLMRVLAQMRQGLGDHWRAIQILTKALDVEPNMEQVQCYFLRGMLHMCTDMRGLWSMSVSDIYDLNNFQ